MHGSETAHPLMLEALALARQAAPHCAPNPAVGCVLTNALGEIIGRGHTQVTGGAHAEAMALADARAHGHLTQGATAWVTLEPCTHHGRTGPCADALIDAGIARVVASLQDPNPRVAGNGFARLRATGVEVKVGAGAAASRELNVGFFKRMERGLPWLRMKAAVSLDGRIALPNGVSQWITSPAAREHGHAWRARAGALLTGIGTILADDPLLNVRLPTVVRQPMLVILDSQWRTLADARLWQVPQRQVVVCGAKPDEKKMAALRACGADVRALPDAHGQVDLLAVLQYLAQQEINELHVEAGSGLNGALWRAGLVDELLLYLAPCLLGAGQGIADLASFAAIDDGPQLHYEEVQRVGADLFVRARTV